jgi:hypothetical protein
LNFATLSPSLTSTSVRECCGLDLQADDDAASRAFSRFASGGAVVMGDQDMGEVSQSPRAPPACIGIWHSQAVAGVRIVDQHAVIVAARL